MYVALLFKPGFTREEALVALDAHFAAPGVAHHGHQSVVTHPAQPQPPQPGQVFPSIQAENAGMSDDAYLAGIGGVHAASAPHARLPPPESQPAAAVPAPDRQLDKEGLPWDDRIHSTPAKLTEAGVYRKRKGLTDEVKTKVARELRAQLASNSAAANGAAPPPPAGANGIPIPADLLARINAGETVTLTPQQIEWLQAQGMTFPPRPAGPPAPNAGLPPPPPGAGLPPPPPAGPSPEELAYITLVTAVGEHIGAKKYDENWIAQVIGHFGGAGATIATIKSTPAVVRAVHDYILTAIK